MRTRTEQYNRALGAQLHTFRVEVPNPPQEAATLSTHLLFALIVGAVVLVMVAKPKTVIDIMLYLQHRLNHTYRQYQPRTPYKLPYPAHPGNL